VKMDAVVLTDFETVTWTYVGYATKDELVHDTSVGVAQLEVRQTAAARAAVVVKSAIPKFMPSIVSDADPLMGVFSRMAVSATLSKLNTGRLVPTTCATLTLAYCGSMLVRKLPRAHAASVLEVQATVVHCSAYKEADAV